ncbi:hypothetical protein NR800_11675 [Corallococcus interemptor]|uniref:hypothetical protein n=1 Tax=Corallococcus interemptor TaxID=2316720 RepID=UPI0035D3FBC3
MRRLLALTSASLFLVCAACGGEEDEAPLQQLQDTRASVTGSHPVVMTTHSARVLEPLLPARPTLELTSEVGSRDGLRVSLAPFDCDLTATMTGASTFALNAGACSLLIPPQEGRFACSIRLHIAEGSGGRETAESRVGVTFDADYVQQCAEDDGPSTTRVFVTLEGE